MMRFRQVFFIIETTIEMFRKLFNPAVFAVVHEFSDLTVSSMLHFPCSVHRCCNYLQPTWLKCSVLSVHITSAGLIVRYYRSLEEITKWIDDGSPVDINYLDFQKAFDKVSHQRWEMLF